LSSRITEENIYFFILMYKYEYYIIEYIFRVTIWYLRQCRADYTVERGLRQFVLDDASEYDFFYNARPKVYVLGGPYLRLVLYLCSYLVLSLINTSEDHKHIPVQMCSERMTHWQVSLPRCQTKNDWKIVINNEKKDNSILCWHFASY